ncbi:PucR family transcriptional regulator [Herbiconiux sp. YIM B11900]|uniref:PucR family transcriptional regulator n=1 Tax=Herbiconiux sp. YIM B11900 TaxID=3404131 RepID=UPI003F83E764
MSERPTTRRTLRLASAAATVISGCAVAAAYVMHGDRLIRHSGRADRRLDLLVEALAGISGVLENGQGWSYALFFRGTDAVKGAFVLHTTAEPSREAMFLLGALAEPTGAALATAELLDRGRRRAHELRQLGQEQEGANRTLTATILRLDSRQRIRDAFAAVAGSGDGETRIVAVLSALTRRSVVLQDSLGSQRAFARVGDSPAPSSLRAPVTGPASAPATTGWRPTEVRSGGEIVGVIGVWDPHDDRGDDDRFAVEHASAVIAVELMHQRRVAAVEIRLGRNLADDLVLGTDVVGARARAEMLRFDLDGSQRAVLVSWEQPSPNGVDIAAALGHDLMAMRVPALLSRRADAVLVIVAADADLSPLHARLSSSVASGRGTIGVGSPGPAGELPRSFAEAGRALKIRVESVRPYGLSTYDDLGLLRILDTSNDGVDLGRYLDEWLGALIEHDRDHHSELVHTLALYLDSGGNYDRAAQALTIHRSTLRYRLGRIRELTGRDLADPDSRLHLHIAVRARAALRDGAR